jgi:hypothetical protein
VVALAMVFAFRDDLSSAVQIAAAEKNYSDAVQHMDDIANGSASVSVAPEALDDATANQEVISGPSEPTVSIVAVCREKWPLDFAMQEHCRQEQVAAELTIKEMEVERIVGQICTQKWPDDWNMYLYCVKEQSIAKTQVSERPLRPVAKIQDVCDREWPDNFSMQADCVQREEEAQNSFFGRHIDDEIARHCATEWPDKWTMFTDCVERQEDDRRKL